MIRFIRHEGETIVVEVAGQQHTLTRRLRWYVKSGGLLIDEEVQRWAVNDLHAVRISRPILKIGGKPLKAWAVSSSKTH